MDKIRDDFNLNFIKKFCKLIGVWTVSPENAHLYGYWTRFCVVFNILYVLALLIQQVISININDLYINLCEVAMLAKMINILSYRRRIVHLLERMHHEDNFQVNDFNVEEVRIVEKQMKNYRKFANAYFIMTVFAVCIGTLNGIGEEPPQMAFAAWYPFGMTDMTVPWKFRVIFLYQGIPIISHALVNVSWDNLFMYLVTNVQLQFELLNHRIKQSFMCITEDNDKKMNKIFHNFNAIMTLNDEIQEIFNITMFIQFNLSSVILCTTVILLIDAPPLERTQIFIQLNLFLVSMLTEILLPCLFANEVTLEYHKIMDAAYDTHWFEMSISDRKLLINFMERLKTPAEITANSFYKVNLATFMRILNASYSLFAILKNAE